MGNNVIVGFILITFSQCAVGFFNYKIDENFRIVQKIELRNDEPLDRIHDKILMEKIGDRDLLWKTVPYKTLSGEIYLVSPNSTINAVGRVFQIWTKFIGMGRSDFYTSIHYKHRKGYAYHAPFFESSGKNYKVIRFDNGFTGWQINVRFSGVLVSGLEIEGIH